MFLMGETYTDTWTTLLSHRKSSQLLSTQQDNEMGFTGKRLSGRFRHK